MAHAVGQRGLSPLRKILNSDGRSHPKENVFSVAAVLLGLVAFVAGPFSGLHLVASWVGLVGIVVGGWGLMISKTTGERFLLIIGLGAAAVGFYLGMAQGGLFGGLIN